MDAEELHKYIEDLEVDKQHTMTRFEALETQEKGYQKQLEVQKQSLNSFQEDLEKYKGSSLTSEIERSQKTINGQRKKLEQLTDLAKNLKVQLAHVKQRQDPLRELVEKQNMQEKALIRYIRLNYDQRFMPDQAFG